MDATLMYLQHKLVTLLLMDIAGSTTIAQDMYPEDVREVLDITLTQQGVRVLEQRAVTSLNRLMQIQGKGREDNQILA